MSASWLSLSIAVVGLAALFLAWLGCVRVSAANGSALPGKPLEYAGSSGLHALVAASYLAIISWLIGQMGVDLPLWLIALSLLGVVAWSVRGSISLAQKRQRPRQGYESVMLGIMCACAVMAVLVTFGIIYTVFAEAWSFFSVVPVTEFLFGLEWSPQIAIRADQAGASGSFGMLPVLLGTVLISGIAMLVAVPLGLLSAIYLSEFASDRFRDVSKPILEFLAGIPTVVYGFFALVVLSPFLRDLGSTIGVGVSGESALAAGLVIGVMTLPFVASLSEDALFAVPDELRHGSLALGSTRGETTLRVAVPAALPGIVAGFLLALSRALGETMIVVMAAGLTAHLTVNPLEAVTTVTVQIVTLLTGDQAFDDPKTLAAFALGLMLFLFTLALNLFALGMVRKYQERYD